MTHFENLSWSIINKPNSRFMPDFEIDDDSNYITMVSLKRDADRISYNIPERILQSKEICLSLHRESNNTRI